MQLSAIVKRTFVSQVFTVGQKAAVEYCGNNYLVTINSLLVSGAGEGVTSQRGCLVPDTSFVFEAAHGSAIKITNQKSTINASLFKTKDFSFEKLGIGGLDKQFEDIFRRAFSSRVMRRRAWNLRFHIIIQRGHNVKTQSRPGPRYRRSVIVMDKSTRNDTVKSTNDAAPMVIVPSMTPMDTSMGAIMA